MSLQSNITKHEHAVGSAPASLKHRLLLAGIISIFGLSGFGQSHAAEPVGTLAHWSFEGTGSFGPGPNGYAWSAVAGWGGTNITERSVYNWNTDITSPATLYDASGTGQAPLRLTNTASRLAGTHSALRLRTNSGLPTSSFILPTRPAGAAIPQHNIKDSSHDRAQWETGVLWGDNVVRYWGFSMKILPGATFDGTWCLFAQVHPAGGPPVFQIGPGVLPGESTATTTYLYGVAENTQTLPTARRTGLKRSRLLDRTGTADMAFKRNEWYDFVLKFRFGDPGIVEVWVKGASEPQSAAWKAWSYSGPVRFVATNAQYAFLLDIYRGMFKDSAGKPLMNRPKTYEVHFDEVRMADSRATVTGLMPPPR